MKYIDKLQKGNKVPFVEKVKNAPKNKSQIDKNSQTIVNLYQRALKKGLSRPQVLGLLGNIAVETMGSFDPEQKQLGGGPGRGLIQMEVGTTRYKDFLSKVKNPTDLNAQFDYILDTMFDQSTPNLLNVWGGYGRQDKWVKNPNLPVSTSTKLLSDLYFRPGKPNIEERQKAANYIGEKLNSLSIENFIPKFPSFKKGGWIQKAINPKHKGYCTPMTKSTCTPHRKALARRFKSGEFKKQNGGTIQNLINRINNKNVDFINRLKDSNRQVIPNWKDITQVSTHKMSWATNDKGQAIVFPQIQKVSNQLIDYTNPQFKKWDGLRNAIQTGDTIMTTPKLAKEFTENYKKFYPNFDKYQHGGKINYDISNILSKWKN